MVVRRSPEDPLHLTDLFILSNATNRQDSGMHASPVGQWKDITLQSIQ